MLWRSGASGGEDGAGGTCRGLSRSPWPRSCAGTCCGVRCRGHGAKERRARGPILARVHDRNFPVAAVFEPGRAGLVAASGAASTGRRRRLRGHILVRRHDRNFPAAAVFEPAGAGLVAASGASVTGRRRGEPGGPFLCRRYGRNFPAAAVFEPGRAGLVAASGAAATGRRKGEPGGPFLRGCTAGTSRRRFLSRRGRACCCVRGPAPEAWGGEGPGAPFLRGDTAGTFPWRRFLSRQGVHPMPEMAIFASASDAAPSRRAELR